MWGRGALCGLVLFGAMSCRPVEIGVPTGGKAVAPASSVNRDRMTQISVINALMLGQYDGVISIEEMLDYGDFGLGTLDHLDGELIVLDGTAYRVGGDGNVVEVEPHRTTPFAVVTSLQIDDQFRCDTVASLAKLDQLLDERIGHQNDFIAIRVDGQFGTVTVRSVKRQEPPYQPLAAVARSQGVWTHEGLSGTLVGIRCPPWVHGINVPGFHWHFISDDRQVGGHVLACQIRGAQISYDVCNDWLVRLPDTQQFNALDLGLDLRAELKSVERSRTDTPHP